MSTRPGYELDMMTDGGSAERPGYSPALGVIADIGDEISNKHPAECQRCSSRRKGTYQPGPSPTWTGQERCCPDHLDRSGRYTILSLSLWTE